MFLLLLSVVLLIESSPSIEGTGTPGPLDEIPHIASFTGKINEEGLPDLNHPGVYHQLTCSVCRNVARDLHEELNGHWRDTPIGETAQAELLENLCEKLAGLHGIYQPNRPTSTTKDDDKRPDKGYWVNAFFVSRCSEVIDQQEEYIFKEYKKTETEYMMDVCPHCFQSEREAVKEGLKQKQKEVEEEERQRKKAAGKADL